MHCCKVYGNEKKTKRAKALFRLLVHKDIFEKTVMFLVAVIQLCGKQTRYFFVFVEFFVFLNTLLAYTFFIKEKRHRCS